MNKQWDVFISHASEDKDTIVRSIANELKSFGAKVWYDEFSLNIGDSLSRSIDKGLSESNYGVVILSPDFLSKPWTEYELKGLIAKEIGRDKVILPIWHNISREEILSYSPTLADKISIDTKKNTIYEISLKILEIIRPDLFTKIHKRVIWEYLYSTAKKKEIDIQEIEMGPILHEKLPDELVVRVRLIRASLLSVLPYTMEYWLDGFKRDAHPSEEIGWWEHVAASFLEYIQLEKLTHKQYLQAFAVIFGLCNGMKKEKFEEDKLQLPDGALNKIIKIINYKTPIFELTNADKGFPQSTKIISQDDLEKIDVIYALKEEF